jgi:hypothetical protein
MDYRAIDGLMPARDADGLDPASSQGLVSHLVDLWLEDYGSGTNIVEVGGARSSHLFDIDAERLVAGWAVSRGKHDEQRDKARMKGHPLSAGPLYHRGHAIPHTLGGSLDINLVPQLGSVNVGAFRKLENEAVATPGALYFTYWRYPPGPGEGGFPSQRPIAVDQGLLIPGKPPKIVHHAN